MAALGGRTIIYTDIDEVTSENVASLLESAFQTHETNRAQIQTLYDYYVGKQDIQNRVKNQGRTDINNKICVNMANQIVTFDVGYLMSDPIQYIVTGSDDDVAKAVDELNMYMFATDKRAKDTQLAEWFYICGTSYRIILPSKDDTQDAPYRHYVLDPRDTFVIYSTELDHHPVAGVTYVTRTDGEIIYSVYAKNKYFQLAEDGTILEEKATALEWIPIIEYPANYARLGAFEIVIDLLDARNLIESNRIDSEEQIVQAFLFLRGIDVESESYEELKNKGCLVGPNESDAKFIVAGLEQGQTQILVEDIEKAIYTIVGMPNRNGGSSVSDNVGATIFRDGWEDAETRASKTEQIFDISEKEFIRQAIALSGLKLKTSSVEIHFSRHNSDNISTKATVLTQMLACDDIHPLLSFTASGLFTDPQGAYKMSMEYKEEQENKQMDILERDEADREIGNSESVPQLRPANENEVIL